MHEIVAFAREQKNLKAPCYALVSAWLRRHGVQNVPSDSQARRLWMTVGPENGLIAGAVAMGLKEDNPEFGDVAVVEQDGGDPLLAVIGSNGFCVVRSFGRVVVWKPKILRSWRLPWERQ